MTLQQYSDGSIGETYKAAEVYDESTLYEALCRVSAHQFKTAFAATGHHTPG